jgi:S-adenosylmethionine uptake transporter
LIGLFLLFEPRLIDEHPFGRGLSLASGFFSAMAYIMVARGGKANPPHVVIFYFCIVSALVHLLIFAVDWPQWPDQFMTWGYLVSAGVLATLGQHFLTRAYQNAPAALNAAVSYIGPVVSMAANVAFFGLRPDGRAWGGAAIVLVCGVALPFVRPQRKLFGAKSG